MTSASQTRAQLATALRPARPRLALAPTRSHSLPRTSAPQPPQPCTRPPLPPFNVSAETVTFSLPHLVGRRLAALSLVCYRSNFLSETPILFEKQAAGSGSKRARTHPPHRVRRHLSSRAARRIPLRIPPYPPSAVSSRAVSRYPARQPDIVPAADGSFELRVIDGDYFTVSTLRRATKGGFDAVPSSVPGFPLPHFEDFQAKPISQEAAYFADQIGAFEVHTEAAEAELHAVSHGGGVGGGHAASPGGVAAAMVEEEVGSINAGGAVNKVLRQMVPQLPIGWSDHGSNGPMTLLGMREWHDISVSVDFRLPVAASAACIATRVEQMWKEGVVLCVGQTGSWNLTYGGPPQNGNYDLTRLVTKGTAGMSPGVGTWHTLSLTTVGGVASGSLDGTPLFAAQAVRDLDTGFAAIGTNAWYPIEFDNVNISQAGGGSHWSPQTPPSCGAATAGKALTVRPCQANGVVALDQSFELVAQDWKVRHLPSGLCVTTAASDAPPTLESCVYRLDSQSFENDYTSIRNLVVPLSTPDGRQLQGTTDGSVFVSSRHPPALSWDKWSYFPNTNQLRNQYTPILDLGYPMCLSTCGVP